MPVRSNAREIKLQLTDDQHAALKREAERLDVDMSVLIRRVLAEAIDGFPGGDFITRGTYERKPKAKS